MHSGLLQIAAALLVLFAALSLLTFLLLVVLRLVLEAVGRRDRDRSVQIRGLLLEMLLGDETVQRDAARARLVARTGRGWDLVEDQCFRMLAKVRGQVRTDLSALLLEKGADRRSRRLMSSWSSVRRCRGAYRLGTLGREEDLQFLLEHLHDRVFLVRRMTVRALGALAGQAAAVPALLDAAPEAELQRDLVFALDRIGSEATPALRVQLQVVLGQDGPDEDDRARAEVAARGLGVVGALSAVPDLQHALGSGWPQLQAAAATALGRIGLPSSLDPVTAALANDDPRVRHAATGALVELGTSASLTGLEHALDDPDRATARLAARCLLGMGADGRSMLERSGSAYAREAVAVDEVRRSRR